MFSSPCSHLFPTNINLVAKIMLAIVGVWLVSNGPGAICIVVFLQTFARDSLCNITFIPVSTWQLYNAWQSLQHNVHSSINLTAVQCSFWFLEEKTQQFKDFFHFFCSRGWSLSQDLAVVGILSDCSHVKPTSYLQVAYCNLVGGWFHERKL